MNYQELKEQNNRILRNYAYYIIIVAVSLMATCFLPLIGSEADGGFEFPHTLNEWFVFLGSRIIIAFLNVTIFYCFIAQAEINVKDEPNYIEANEILKRARKEKEVKPKSPAQFKAKQWATKGTMLFLSSIGATWVFSDIILRYDLTQLLVYCATIILGVIFGYITQRKNEIYWVTEYLDYAKEYAAKQEEKENGNSI